MRQTVMTLETWLLMACFFYAISVVLPALAFSINPLTPKRFGPSRPLHQTFPVAAAGVTKEKLFNLLEQAPRNIPTSQQLTNDILSTVRLLEKECPTPDAEVLEAIAGPWELLWTAQDPQVPESNRLFLSWINPLENQSYSNNPSSSSSSSSSSSKGRSNPILPRELEDKLEEAGLTTSVGDFRSTQTIDMKSKQVINVVTVDLKWFRKQSRRATITVLVDFVPNRRNARQIDVKFQACRFNVNSFPVDWNIPLGILGPRGWLNTIYVDDTIRITRGHKGSVFILKRPGK